MHILSQSAFYSFLTDYQFLTNHFKNGTEEYFGHITFNVQSSFLYKAPSSQAKGTKSTSLRKEQSGLSSLDLRRCKKLMCNRFLSSDTPQKAQIIPLLNSYFKTST